MNDKLMQQRSGSESYQDSSPPEDFVPEDMWDATKIPDTHLRRTVPKRVNPQRDWYDGKADTSQDSDVSNRYDNAEPVIGALRVAKTRLDERIVSLQKLGSNTDVQFSQTLSQRAQVHRCLKELTNLSFDRGVTYAQFPAVVRRFIQTKYQSELALAPKLAEYLNSYGLKKLPVPQHLINNIGAATDPDRRVIYYFIDAKDPEVFQQGLVHELVHVIQHYLQGLFLSVSKPPQISPEYYKLNNSYRLDGGEVEAEAITREFLDYMQTQKYIQDYAKTQQDMFDRRVSEIGVDEKNIFWENDYYQVQRFKAIASIDDLTDKTLLDVGCGYGDLFGYLQQKGIKLREYLGIDIADKACQEAKDRHPEADFLQANIHDLDSRVIYDYVVASGIFTLYDVNWREVIKTTVKALLDKASRGVAVNFLKADISGTRDGIYLYLNAADIIKLLADLVDRVEYVHEYLPDDTDFTLHLFK